MCRDKAHRAGNGPALGKRGTSMNDARMQRYSEIIIEHSQFPRHHGNIENPTHEGRGENPFCGDRVSLKFTVNAAGIIEQAAIESVGCAISTASASLLASHLHGLNLSQAEELFEQVRNAITGPRTRSVTRHWGNWLHWHLPAVILPGSNARHCHGMS